MTTNVEISCPTSDEASFENEAKRKSIQISERPSDLLSKEGFALYIGKTPRAVAEMAKAGKLPAFYMTDPLKPRGKAELTACLTFCARCLLHAMTTSGAIKARCTGFISSHPLFSVVYGRALSV